MQSPTFLRAAFRIPWDRTPVERALYSVKRALDSVKSALYSGRRALDSVQRGLYLIQRAKKYRALYFYLPPSNIGLLLYRALI